MSRTGRPKRRACSKRKTPRPRSGFLPTRRRTEPSSKASFLFSQSSVSLPLFVGRQVLRLTPKHCQPDIAALLIKITGRAIVHQPQVVSDFEHLAVLTDEKVGVLCGPMQAIVRCRVTGVTPIAAGPDELGKE